MRRILLFILVFSALFSCLNTEKRVAPTEEAASVKGAGEDSLSRYISIDYLTGRFLPDTHTDFSLIEPEFANRPGMYLRTDAYDSFKRMYEAAKEDTIALIIISATRPFNHQKSIWEKKWNGEKLLEAGVDATEIQEPVERAKAILKYSSMPGISRHHWGTDIDLNALTNTYFENGTGEKVYAWLAQYARQYGYCQPYTSKDSLRPVGYEEEKWHWSYVPISAPLTHYAEAHLRNSAISGFEGSSTAADINVVENYVLGINPECLDKIE